MNKSNVALAIKKPAFERLFHIIKYKRIDDEESKKTTLESIFDSSKKFESDHLLFVWEDVDWYGERVAHLVKVLKRDLALSDFSYVHVFDGDVTTTLGVLIDCFGLTTKTVLVYRT